MLFQIFSVFFKVGAFTIGGGYAMISVVKNSIVDKRKWLNEDEFDQCITVAQALPGVFAVNMALYTGQKIGGRKAALVAAAGSVLPSIIIIAVIAEYFKEFQNNSSVAQVMRCIHPCITALILAPGIQMLIKSCKKFNHRSIPIIICSVAFCLIYFLSVSPVIVITGIIITAIIISVKNIRL